MLNPNHQKRRHGFTLIELMVSSAVLAVIMFYLTNVLVFQSRSYEVVDDVTEVQQNLRAIGDLVEREVRSTGMLVQEGGAACAIDNDFQGSDILFVTDSQAINPANLKDAGLGSTIVAGYSGNGTDNVTLSRRALEPDQTLLAYDNDSPLNGASDSDFFWPGVGLGGGVIVTDKKNPERGAQCGMITRVVQTGLAGLTVDVDWTIRIGANTHAPAPAGLGPVPLGGGAPELVMIPANMYLVDRTVPNQPRLWRNGTILADDVEDLQVAFFHDADDDGIVDPGEWSGDTAATPYTSGLVDNTFLRAIRFSMVIRSAQQDVTVVQDPNLAFGLRPVLENAPVPVAAADGFRRRVQTRTVRPRNVGLRGNAYSGSL